MAATSYYWKQCPPGIETQDGPFRKLAWLCIPCMLAGRGSTVCVKMDGGGTYPAPTFFPPSMVHIPLHL